ncbi:NPC intracellular cholesterol transporter 2-like isoform X2 [Sipha flava]|uniref:NPC intracellular cholesterol transporter 2-like isoform X2 n=1 Tax=Sipha flava TaxID=143950 RepID=A0A8B8FR65_9HEMI|nr:NPC intracellular cholesterol transporter 2-like isoform X2 [Sipha flava]
MFDKIIFMSFLLIILLHKSKSTTVYKCGSKNKEVLNNTLVMFENCTISRCPLKKNSTMHIEIKFKPDKKNVCTNIIEEDGTKKNCPLQKGSTYIYKDDIYIIETYPKFKIDVHWSLKDPISRNVITCFEVPAKIID